MFANQTTQSDVQVLRDDSESLTMHSLRPSACYSHNARFNPDKGLVLDRWDAGERWTSETRHVPIIPCIQRITRELLMMIPRLAGA